MIPSVLPLLVLGAAAGTFGSLFGVGGGVVLVPALVLLFGVPVQEAAPVGLLAVVATSSAAAASFLERELSDLRLALVLELATVTGAIGGGLGAAFLPPAWVAIGFGTFLFFVATQLGASPMVDESVRGAYEPRNYPLGLAGSFAAGGISAILGVGGGPLKVPLMNLGMGVPFKVASATSNLMLGVTAVASLSAYLRHGSLRMDLAPPVVVGVFLGASAGARWMERVPAAKLRRAFAVVLVLIAAQMLWKGGRELWPGL